MPISLSSAAVFGNSGGQLASNRRTAALRADISRSLASTDSPAGICRVWHVSKVQCGVLASGADFDFLDELAPLVHVGWHGLPY
jgi:hypothetical protein